MQFIRISIYLTKVIEVKSLCSSIIGIQCFGSTKNDDENIDSPNAVSLDEFKKNKVN
jgi:hypothetical protein